MPLLAHCHDAYAFERAADVSGVEAVVTWLVRYAHVLAAACWAGGYVLLALVLVPAVRRHPSQSLVQVMIGLVRVLTYVGAATIVFGLVLVARTRGFGSLLHGEWGAIVLLGLLIAVGLMGIGDGALRPGLRRLAATGDGTAAGRWAAVSALLSVAAVGLMTRALYASG